MNEFPSKFFGTVGNLRWTHTHDRVLWIRPSASVVCLVWWRHLSQMGTHHPNKSQMKFYWNGNWNLSAFFPRFSPNRSTQNRWNIYKINGKMHLSRWMNCCHICFAFVWPYFTCRNYIPFNLDGCRCRRRHSQRWLVCLVVLAFCLFCTVKNHINEK